ncbi:MAG: zinc ribbon domain-containing protein [Promethearchaeota archaeon]
MSPRPARIRRRIVRRAVRRPLRRNIRRARRILWRTTRRLILGTSVLLMIGGSYAVYKLTQHDLEKIEQETGKSAENMTEEELKTAMRKLGIQKMELTPDDEIQINRVVNVPETKKFCTYCGAQLDSNAKFCPSCGQKV